MIRKVDSFQHRLKIALDDAKISQSELGRRTGINRQLISDYLKGKYEAKQDKLYELAKVLNVDEGWLMGVSDKKERRHPEEVQNTNNGNGDITSEDIDHYFNGLLVSELVSTFKDRLREGINYAGLTQSELARRSGIHRAIISDYVRGKYEAKQDKLYELAKVLNVSEAWLMGYDVKKERRHPEEVQNTNNGNGDITSEDIDHYFNGLTEYK